VKTVAKRDMWIERRLVHITIAGCRVNREWLCSIWTNRKCL